MLRSMNFGLFFLLSLMGTISAEICYYGTYSSYYCSPGQTCGTYYGDCRGLSTYVIIGIVSSCIVLLSITIRFCIYMCNNNTKPAPSLVAVHTSGHVPVHVRPFGNNMGTQPPRNAPVHTFREDAPPTYATATSSNTGAPKY